MSSAIRKAMIPMTNRSSTSVKALAEVLPKRDVARKGRWPEIGGSLLPISSSGTCGGQTLLYYRILEIALRGKFAGPSRPLWVGLGRGNERLLLTVYDDSTIWITACFV